MEFPEEIEKEVLSAVPVAELIEIGKEFKKVYEEGHVKKAVSNAITYSYLLGYMNAKKKYCKEEQT